MFVLGNISLSKMILDKHDDIIPVRIEQEI